MSTLVMGVLILGEPMNAWIAVGTGLVLGGVFLVSRPSRQAERQP
jgi:drug/metabolite transporter (DMT)-like permease